MRALGVAIVVFAAWGCGSWAQYECGRVTWQVVTCYVVCAVGAVLVGVAK